MVNLFWPGAERRGDQFTEDSFIEAMVHVEAAWLASLVEFGIAPADAAHDLVGVVGVADAAAIAADAEVTGTPVLPVVELLRERLASSSPATARWLHRGLTSQDVLDSALMLMLRESAYRVRYEVKAQISCLVPIVEAHRSTAMVARTLTQHAVPTTFGLKAAGWLLGIVDAGEGGDSLAFPVQLGGAAGTLAAVVELAAGAGAADPAGLAFDVVEATAARLSLTPSLPWHTRRAAVTRISHAAVECTNVWGAIANDVLVLSRPEIGELSEGSPGGSSTMPGKRNPVLAALVRRASLVAPSLGSALNLAAAEVVDERAAGAWHAEWAVVTTLAQATVTAASQVTDLLAGLQVHGDRMAATLASAAPQVMAEQRSMADLVDRPHRTDPASYLGAGDVLIDRVLDRARSYLDAHEVIA